MFSKADRLFRDLRKHPRDQENHEELANLFIEKPIAFIREFLQNLHHLKDKKDETELPPDPFEQFRKTWVNTIHKERVQPLLYLTPTTQQELVELIQDAESKGRMVRAVGMGHSFSDVANATDVLVDTLGLKKVLDLESDTFTNATHAKTLFSCEAGMMVADLNEELDKRGLAVTTMAAFDQETIYGAIATSTHGTGIRVEGMSKMLLSMDLVSSGGKKYRLEPSDGITDPAKFKAKYPNGEVELIQDDDKFRSSTVGFGLMGIVYSVVLEPRKLFYLKQRLWMTTWSQVKPKLEDGSFFTEIDPKGTKIQARPDGSIPPTRAQVFVNPYQTKNHWHKEFDYTCVVQVQTEISEEEFLKLKAEEPKHPIKIIEFVEQIITNGSHGTHIETIEDEDKESTLEQIGVELLATFMDTYPEITPLILDVSLIVLLSGSGKIGKSYVVMNQGKISVKNAGYSVEPGFAVDENKNFIKGTEEIFRTLTSIEDAKAYQTAPICLRFVKASPDYMSPEYQVDTCMIDVPMLIGTIGDDQMMDRMQKNLIGVGARPHWGKICNMVNNKALISKMYPKLPEFLDTMKFFNPNGTFNGAFSYRTGLTELAYDRD